MTSSDVSAAAAGVRERPAEVRDTATSERSAETRAGGDAPHPARSSAARRETADARKERKDAKAERAKSALKNKVSDHPHANASRKRTKYETSCCG